MKSMGKFSLAAVAALLVFWQGAEARKPEVSHEDIVVQKGETFEGDVATDRSLLVDGKLNGDATAVGGGSVTINGELTGDLVSMGGPVSVNGKVDGNVSSIGGQVSISGRVAGNVSSMGAGVNLIGDAEVDGDISTLGGTVQKAPKARHKGSVNSFSQDAIRGTLASTLGMVRNAGRYDWGPRRERRFQWRMDAMDGMDGHDMWMLGGLLGLGLLIFFSVLATGLLLIVLPAIFFPRNVERVREAMDGDIWKACALGAVALVGFFPVLLMMVVSILGIPLVPFAVMLFAAAAVLGLTAFSVILQGRFFEGLKKQGPSGLVAKAAVGYALIAGMLFFGKMIPLIGGLISLIGTILLAFGVMVGLGAAWMTRMGSRPFTAAPPPAVPPVPAAPQAQQPPQQPPQAQ